ncbi:hypothetical protein B9Z33_10350 [Limnohabitans sp. T6-20]|nr:hypothetical protein B9Z33_10350 [Limnohabitans sp. T6-20]
MLLLKIATNCNLACRRRGRRHVWRLLGGTMGALALPAFLLHLLHLLHLLRMVILRMLAMLLPFVWGLVAWSLCLRALWQPQRMRQGQQCRADVSG